MSTGAECNFIEKQDGWYYELQRWPYGEWPEYDTYGPFETYALADRHLRAKHTNPGGCTISPLPGCEHDLHQRRGLRPTVFDPDTHRCLRCGMFFTPKGE